MSTSFSSLKKLPVDAKLVHERLTQNFKFCGHTHIPISSTEEKSPTHAVNTLKLKLKILKYNINCFTKCLEVAKEKQKCIEHIISCHQQTKVNNSCRHTCTSS
jgi:hypothetical protein